MSGFPEGRATPEQEKSLAKLGGGGESLPEGGALLKLTLACASPEEVGLAFGWEGHALGGVHWSSADTPTFPGYSEPVSGLVQMGSDLEPVPSPVDSIVLRSDWHTNRSPL